MRSITKSQMASRMMRHRKVTKLKLVEADPRDFAGLPWGHPDLVDAREMLRSAQGILRGERRLRANGWHNERDIRHAADRVCRCLDWLWHVQEKLDLNSKWADERDADYKVERLLQELEELEP